MPTIQYINASDVVDAKPQAINPDNYTKYPLPLRIGNIDKEFLENNILSGKELCFIKLNTLCNAYFQHPKLLQLSRLTYGEDGEGIGNACFYICLGTKTAYDEVLKSPTSIKKGNILKSLFIAPASDYKNLFVNFLKEMFKNNETDVLDKTYIRDDILTISLFYRDYRKNQTGRVMNYDYLIGVASIVIDSEPSCFLSWLGISIKLPCKKPSCSLTKELDNMRGALNIGSFFIATCQWLKSLLVERWVPLICQVYKVETKGPVYFYQKNYFLRLLRDHPLVHEQYLRRRDHIIEDDFELHWYSLFHPLQYLTMFEVLDKIDEECIGLIWERATFFFLNQKMFDFSQDSLLPMLETCFGQSLKTEQTFVLNKFLLDQVFNEDSGKEWLYLKTNDAQKDSTKIIASVDVIHSILKSEEHKNIRTISFDYEANDLDSASYLFLLASKIYFGKASYHYIIRQFFYFVYRSLSKLKSTHRFFETVMPTLVQIIITRTYSDVMYNQPILIDNNGLPEQLKQISDEKTGKILKMYYKKLLALYSESFLKPTFKSDESDIYMLKDFFKSALRIININSNEDHPVEANYNRQWEIQVNSSNETLSPAIENIQPFIQYIRSITNTADDIGVKSIWLARVNVNELYILEDDNENNADNILRLPRFIGGQLFTAKDDNDALWIPPQMIDDDTLPLILVENAGKIDLVVERVEKESSIKNILKLYYQYLKERKWKKYSKLLDTKGGKVDEQEDDDPLHAIGPLYEIEDLTNAKIDEDMLMPIFRILDPWREVYDSGNLAIRNRIGFKELLTFRKKTWLDVNAINVFLSILNDPVFGFSSHCYILDNTEFMQVIQSQELICKFLGSLPKECVLILICVYVESHYLVVEIEKPSIKNTEIVVKIADSGSSSENEFEAAIDAIRNAGVDLLACSLNAHLPIDYQDATDVVKQDNNYDCGVRCMQRMYCWKRFGNPTTIPSEYDYLKDCDIFRLFALGEIVKYYRKNLSPLVYFDSPIHKSIRFEFANYKGPTEVQHDSVDVNAATDLMNLSLSDTTQHETGKTSSQYSEKMLHETEIPSVNSPETNTEILEEVNNENSERIPNEAMPSPSLQEHNEAFEFAASTSPNDVLQRDNTPSAIDTKPQDTNNFNSSDGTAPSPKSLEITTGNKAAMGVSTSPNDASEINAKSTEVDTTPQETNTLDITLPSVGGRKSVSAKALLLQNTAFSDNGSDSDDGTESEDEEEVEEAEEADEDEDADMNDKDDSDYKSDASTSPAASRQSAKTKVSFKVPMTHKVIRKLNARTGKVLEYRVRDDEGNYIMVPAIPDSTTDNASTSSQQNIASTKKKKSSIAPKKTTDNASTSSQQKISSTKQKKSSKAPKKRTVDISKSKKLVGKKRKKTTSKEEERQRKLAIRNAESSRKKKLASINNEIDRWENWHDVADGPSEIDIYSNDANYFINKKLPPNTPASIKKDINRLKTKLYDPEQCDPKRARLHVDSKFNNILTNVRARHAAAEALLEDMEKGTGRYQKQQKEIARLNESIRFHEYQAQSQAELLPFDSVYALRTKRDQTGSQKEYYAVAKSPDGSFKEKLITRDWVTQNVEKEFLDRFAQAELEKAGFYFLRKMQRQKSLRIVTSFKNY